MPEKRQFRFYDLKDFPSWVQYTVAAKSLLTSLELDDPEQTLMVQFTLSELTTMTFGLTCLVRMFPEFTPVANALSDKIQEVGQAQHFIKETRLDQDE